MAPVLENCFSFSLFEAHNSRAVVALLFCFPWWLIHGISVTPSSCSLKPLIKHSEVAVIALAAKNNYCTQWPPLVCTDPAPK